MSATGLLRDNTGFRRLWAGQTISLFGDQVSLLAFPLIAALVLHAGPAQMGLLVAVQMAPNLLFALPLGAWVDRRGRRRQLMIAADAGRAAVLLSVPVAYAEGGLTLAQLYAVGFVTGTLTLLFRVAYPTLITTLVPGERYIEANQWTNGSRALASVGGPSLGGLLIQALSGPVAVMADAASYVASAVLVTRVGPVEPPVGPVELVEDDRRVVAGLRMIWSEPLLRSSLIACTIVNLFNYAVLAIFVLYCTRSLHVSPGRLGLILGVGAIGGVVGSIVTGPLSQRFGVGPAYIAGMFLFALPIVLVPAAGGSRVEIDAMLLTAELVSGFGVMLLDILAGSLFQAVVPDQLRARFMGAFLLVNYGIRPFGALLGGTAATLLGLHAALWIGAVGGVIGGVPLLLSPTRRVRHLPAPAAA